MMASVETYPIQDIATILADDKTPERTKLFILLMLNTGAFQVDIAHLLKSQVDLKQGRIERKRSKQKTTQMCQLFHIGCGVERATLCGSISPIRRRTWRCLNEDAISPATGLQVAPPG